MPSAFGKPVTTANRFGAVAAGQVWTLVTTVTASSSASLTITGLSSASYKTYALIFAGWRAATASRVDVRFSLDSGATFPTGVTSHYIIQPATSTTLAGSSNDLGDFAAISNYLSDDSRTNANGVLYFSYGLVASARSELSGHFGGYGPALQNICVSACSFNSATEVNAIKLSLSGGNITNGNIKVYGIT